MEIEVKHPSSVYVKAFVDDVLLDGIKVSYENGWHPSELVTYDRCRAVLSDGLVAPLNTSLLKINDIIEAYIKQPLGDICAWQSVKVRDVKVIIFLLKLYI